MSALLRFKYTSRVFLTTLICVISLQSLTAYAEALPNHKELPSESCRASQAENSFTRISMEEAKKMMEMDDGHVIVDVRTEEEYASGHIPGAICIPNETIYKDRPAALPDLDQVILVYCRSGNRSKRSARMLYEMGYTNVYEFGGIIDWDGEIEEARTLSTLSVYRYGEIMYDSYSIFQDEDGYHVSVNDEEPVPMSEEAVQALMGVIEVYNISSWDGFSEENENVLDGEGFSLEIGFTDGTSVKAQGDNAFPDRYADAMGEIWDILTDVTTAASRGYVSDKPVRYDYSRMQGPSSAQIHLR